MECIDIWDSIFSLLWTREIRQIARVCKQFNNIVTSSPRTKKSKRWFILISNEVYLLYEQIKELIQFCIEFKDDCLADYFLSQRFRFPNWNISKIFAKMVCERDALEWIELLTSVIAKEIIQQWAFQYRAMRIIRATCNDWPKLSELAVVIDIVYRIWMHWPSDLRIEGLTALLAPHSNFAMVTTLWKQVIEPLTMIEPQWELVEWFDVYTERMIGMREPIYIYSRMMVHEYKKGTTSWRDIVTSCSAPYLLRAAAEKRATWTLSSIAAQCLWCFGAQRLPAWVAEVKDTVIFCGLLSINKPYDSDIRKLIIRLMHNENYTLLEMVTPITTAHLFSSAVAKFPIKKIISHFGEKGYIDWVTLATKLVSHGHIYPIREFIHQFPQNKLAFFAAHLPTLFRQSSSFTKISQDQGSTILKIIHEEISSRRKVNKL